MNSFVTLKGDWENSTMAQIQDQFLDLNNNDICTLKLMLEIKFPMRDNLKEQIEKIHTECSIPMELEEENGLLASVYLYKFTHQKQVILVLIKTLYNYFVKIGAITRR